MSIPFFEIVSGVDGHRLGRAWLVEKDGKSRMSIDMSSMPLPSQEVHLVNTEGHDMDICAKAYVLKAPIERDGRKTYWHPVGQIDRVEESGDQVFQVSFASIPFSGNLSAFEKEG